jgi:hypothetical protein
MEVLRTDPSATIPSWLKLLGLSKSTDGRAFRRRHAQSRITRASASHKEDHSAKKRPRMSPSSPQWQKRSPRSPARTIAMPRNRTCATEFGLYPAHRAAQLDRLGHWTSSSTDTVQQHHVRLWRIVLQKSQNAVRLNFRQRTKQAVIVDRCRFNRATESRQ